MGLAAGLAAGLAGPAIVMRATTLPPQRLGASPGIFLLRGSLGGSLRGSLWMPLGGSLRGSLRGSLGDSRWASLGASLGDSLWAAPWGLHDRLDMRLQ